MRNSLLVLSVSAALFVLAGTTMLPARAKAAGADGAVTWPVPVPQWFWKWARWYLHRGEFAGRPTRSRETRPAEAPEEIPPWAWRRFAALAGEEQPLGPAKPLSLGSRGPYVVALERALNKAHYPAGPSDGVFDSKTKDGVIAFEKVHGLPRDGVVDAIEYADALAGGRPSPPLRDRKRYVYVDLRRQVLFDVRGGRVERVIPVSTGGGYPYRSSNGNTYIARTPTGSFRIYQKATGWQTSYLGTLYYPSYFRGGYAIHGSPSVPTIPVSHGCIRIPIWLSVEFFHASEIGTPVIVR
jgi:peptidoglycan hydrolase-like protein with peptidoglycan-binding domain